MATEKEQLQEFLNSMKAPTEDIQNVTGLIYGDNGSGKTVAAVQLAQAIRKWKGGKILFVDAVNAWRSLKNHPELHEDLIRVPYQGKSQLDILNKALQYRPAGFENISVVILDEMSSMADKDGDLVLATRAAKDDTKDPDVLTQPDMGATTERMRRTIIKLLQQEVSVIFVSHVRQDEDKSVGYKVTRPRFMPKFSGTIREGLDFVAFMSASPTNVNGTVEYLRTLQVHPTKTTIAKIRIGGLKLSVTPEIFIDGTMKWLKGEVGDAPEQTVVVDDTVPNLSEELNADEPIGVVVD